ncbi:zinc transporter foi-like [Cylas formicarius]|uniref:zinc transporter foi-like n=1 Tax=Cylas formicarius TaxID=197179 RepID=UPI002958D9D0|nr:zinc transporter foi-like [Cylas formicarius]XP_060536202.1 zinc transporter foi-like [Cylas formicarius]XP_060536203.1 zinc transporter foi-like [Cylas formicarius]XP_060536204.1 zinc transporter foi-like [Cylas formicarius]
MAHRLISVCIFCFICATHSPCASHASIGYMELNRHDGYKDPNIQWVNEKNQLNLREKFNEESIPDVETEDGPAQEIGNVHDIIERSVQDAGDKDNSSSDEDFLKKIFLKYGDGDVMTMEGFGKFVKRLRLLQVLSANLDRQDEYLEGADFKMEVREVTEDNKTCLNEEPTTKFVEKYSSSENLLNRSTFLEACPILMYGLVENRCGLDTDGKFEVIDKESPRNTSMVYIYSILAVILISVCGVLALVIIPVMQKRFYKPLIQFLVALAVGTLAGDALLHLLPHAMGASSHEEHHDHNENTWKGFVAMMGLTFFFIMERLILLVGNWRKQKQKSNAVAHAHVKVLDDQGDKRSETQCMDRYNPSPYCYKDIMTDARLASNSDLPLTKKLKPSSLEQCEANRNLPECQSTLISSPCIETKMLPRDHEDYTVIVREHATDHHGHSHKHGHVHAAPQNYSSVAWMVIMGDGLHNFTDGMAIGAAFSSGIAGGFSTTVAVFCHELPHELGDFAMLLKAGMSIKQALFYNMLSSLLCFLGNIFGLLLGNTESANSWLFAAAAGTFIYIALVDMIPELSSAHEDEDNLLQCVLHLGGLLSGFGIMTLIALYEHDLKHLFREPE